MNTQESEVVDVLKRRKATGITCAMLARLLNLDGKTCDWCPVPPPRTPSHPAVVPHTSLAGARRVLLSMVEQGIMCKAKVSGYTIYKLTSQT